MINWQYFPKSDKITDKLLQTIKVFTDRATVIDSEAIDKAKMIDSNTVLSILKDGLLAIGYQVEISKTNDGIIAVPVLYGRNGKPEKGFMRMVIIVKKKLYWRLKPQPL